ILAQLSRRGYQFCVLEAGGLHLTQKVIRLGDKDTAAFETQFVEVVSKGELIVDGNFVSVDAARRPWLLASLLSQLLALRMQTCRPHCMVLDEAGRLLPASAPLAVAVQTDRWYRMLLLTEHPELLHLQDLAGVGPVIAVGHHPELAIAEASRALRVTPPPLE